MTSDFKAFDPALIISDLPKKVQDLVFWDGKLLAALVDATLLVIGPTDAADPTPGQSWQVQRVLKGFGKKYLVNLRVGDCTFTHATCSFFRNYHLLHQRRSDSKSAWPLQVVPSRNALLSASDEGINLHTLPRLQLTAQVSELSRLHMGQYCED